MVARSRLTAVVSFVVAATLVAAPLCAAQRKNGLKRSAKEKAATSTAALKGSAKASNCRIHVPLRERFGEQQSETALGERLSGEGDRWFEWFYGQRTYPGDSLPKGALAKALAHARERNRGRGAKVASATASGRSTSHVTSITAPLVLSTTWSAIGPSQIPGGQTDSTLGGLPNPFAAGTVSGRTSALATHPTNPDILYAGGAQGGVWKTTNATSGSPTWTPLTDDQASLAIGDIAVAPSNGDVIYAGTGEAAGSCDSYYGRGILRSLDGGSTWTLVGNAEFDGQSISKILVHPTNPAVIYASATLGFLASGTEQCDLGPGQYIGAVWKSVDSGDTWSLLNVPTGPPFGSIRIHDMAMDPVTPSTIYAAVRGLGPRGGIWKSTNAGSSFTQVGGASAGQGFPLPASSSPGFRRIRLGIAGADAPGTLFAALEAAGSSALWGLYKTTHGGTTWAHVDNGQHGLGKISNNVLTRQSGPEFTFTMVGQRLILGDSSNANRVSRTVTRVVNHNVLEFSSTDLLPAAPFSRWSVGAYPTYCDGQCFYNITVAVDPSDPNIVYVGGNPRRFRADLSGIPGGHTNWRSNDGGNTWRAISQGATATGGVHTDDHDLAFGVDGAVYDSNDGGTWRSTDGGASWTNMNTNISVTQFQGLALHPSDADYVLGGTQDNGTNIRDAALVTPDAWFHSDFGDGGQSLIDQSSPSTMYHTYFNQSFNFFGPARTDNGGVGGPGSWPFVGTYFGYGSQYYNGMDPTDDVSFYAPMAQHPIYAPNAVYFGSNRVYRADDPQPPCCDLPGSCTSPGGGHAFCTNPPSWTAVSPALTKTVGAPDFPYLSAIGVLPNLVKGKEVLYTGASDGRVAVSSTVDGSGIATWNILDDDSAIVPGRFVTEIEVDASDATGNTAYVTFSGFNSVTPKTPGHVFKITNGLSGSATWTDISGDLPDVPANAIALDIANGAIYVGTDIGVFRTVDGGATWIWLDDGHPNVTVFGLDKSPADGSIVSATHGRGMFRLAPPSQ